MRTGVLPSTPARWWWEGEEAEELIKVCGSLNWVQQAESKKRHSEVCKKTLSPDALEFQETNNAAVILPWDGLTDTAVMLDAPDSVGGMSSGPRGSLTAFYRLLNASF